STALPSVACLHVVSRGDPYRSRRTDGAATQQPVHRTVIRQAAVVGAALIPDGHVMWAPPPTALEVGIIEAMPVKPIQQADFFVGHAGESAQALAAQVLRRSAGLGVPAHERVRCTGELRVDEFEDPRAVLQLDRSPEVLTGMQILFD